MTAPVATGWSLGRVGLAPTGKRRLCTAHTQSRLPLRSRAVVMFELEAFSTTALVFLLWVMWRAVTEAEDGVLHVFVVDYRH